VFQRQKVLLQLIARAGGRIDRLRLMTLLFLARQEGHLTAPTAVYGFVPFRHGPFSFAMERDIAKLAAERQLVEDHPVVALPSPHDLPPLEAASRAGIDAMWERHGSWSTERLLAHVHDTHPWFTSAMEGHDPRPMAEPAVYTAGYERLSCDDFLDSLLRCGMRRVIDVRANPIARRYGFHRSTLQRNLASLGIDYLHLPELGIPGEERADLATTADYDGLFARYAADTLPRQKAAITRVTALQQERATALLCLEADPQRCHRSRLGRVVADGSGLPMLDLGRLATTGADG
jgi:uncharacterized phage-associated protein